MTGLVHTPAVGRQAECTTEPGGETQPLSCGATAETLTGRMPEVG